MSTPSDTINSNIEFCMLVSSATSESFQKRDILRLLMNGADINFQDANRNFNTPLHLAIERENFELVKFLLDFNPSQKIRNMNGERPRDLALKLGLIEVVAVLAEKREESKEFESVKNVESDRKSLDSRVTTYEIESGIFSKDLTVYTSSRVQHLLSITKIDPHFKRTGFDMSNVRQIYSTLDENVFLRPLLKIAKEIRYLEVYFLHELPDNLLNSCAINDLNGTVFICGLQNGSEFAAMLAHKLLHYAMNHINDNDCKPFRRKQAEKMFRFRKIVTVYKRRIESLHPVVQRVFELSDTLWEAELIACAPYFLALHHDSPGELLSITENHKELFDFFYEIVVKDMDDYLMRSNMRRFNSRPVEVSTRSGSAKDPYRTERWVEEYGSNYRDNKRNRKDLEKVCVIM